MVGVGGGVGEEATEQVTVGSQRAMEAAASPILGLRLICSFCAHLYIREFPYNHYL